MLGFEILPLAMNGSCYAPSKLNSNVQVELRAKQLNYQCSTYITVRPLTSSASWVTCSSMMPWSESQRSK